MGAFLDEGLVGVANYEVLADPTEAEVALAVSGTAQAHGVGTLLLDHLASLARRHCVGVSNSDPADEDAAASVT